MRPSVNSLEAIRTRADLSPGVVVLPTGLPTSSGRVVVVEKDFSKVTLCACSGSLAAHDPAISAEQCRTWLCYRELERADPWAGLFFQTFLSWLPLGRQKFPSKSLTGMVPLSRGCDVWVFCHQQVGWRLKLKKCGEIPARISPGFRWFIHEFCSLWCWICVILYVMHLTYAV